MFFSYWSVFGGVVFLRVSCFCVFGCIVWLVGLRLVFRAKSNQYKGHYSKRAAKVGGWVGIFKFLGPKISRNGEKVHWEGQKN